MTDIKSATTLHYLPRGTTYTVSHHNLHIKTEVGWLLGCMYTDITTNVSYSRPYDWFDMGKWVILK